MTHRIGIYAGTFDPVHKGHISFALAAVNQANLEQVCFLPERFPRFKPNASDYKTRINKIKDATADASQLTLLELPDRALNVHETLPELNRAFPDATLVLLVGADVLAHMYTWTEINQLVSTCDFVIGMRMGWDETQVTNILRTLDIMDSRYTIIYTDHAHVSSTAIRASKD